MFPLLSAARLVARTGHRFVGGFSGAVRALLECLPHRGASGRRWHHRGAGLRPLADGSRPGLLEAGGPVRLV